MAARIRYPTDLRTAEDTDFAIRLALAGCKFKMAPKPGAGFAGMDLNIQYSIFDPPGHFLFWKPGSAPYVEPDGFSWRLQPGNDLVLTRPQSNIRRLFEVTGLSDWFREWDPTWSLTEAD